MNAQCSQHRIISHHFPLHSNWADISFLSLTSFYAIWSLHNNRIHSYTLKCHNGGSRGLHTCSLILQAVPLVLLVQGFQGCLHLLDHQSHPCVEDRGGTVIYMSRYRVYNAILKCFYSLSIIYYTRVYIHRPDQHRQHLNRGLVLFNMKHHPYIGRKTSAPHSPTKSCYHLSWISRSTSPTLYASISFLTFISLKIV